MRANEENERIWWIVRNIKQFTHLDSLIRQQDFEGAAKLRDELKKGLRCGDTRTNRKAHSKKVGRPRH
jgi:protein-arginine kinase activator protein McsA